MEFPQLKPAEFKQLKPAELDVTLPTFDTKDIAENRILLELLRRYIGKERADEIIEKIVSEEVPRIVRTCGDKVELSDLLNPNSCIVREINKSVERLLKR